MTELTALSVKYDEIIIALSDLPPASLVALAQRGFTHVLSNEVSSIVVGGIRKAIAEARQGKAGDVTTDEVKAFREANAEIVDTLTANAEKAKLDEITSGKLGQGRTSSGGTRSANPLTKEMRKIALAEVIDVLTAHGLKLPRGEERLAMADGQMLSREDLIERRLAKQGERIQAEAEKVMRAAEKKRAAVAGAELDL